MRRVRPWLLLYPRGARHNRKLDRFCIKSAEPTVTGANRAIKVVLSNNHHIASAAIAAAVVEAAAAFFLLPPNPIIPFAKTENFYVIYYGHLVGGRGEMTEQASRILAAGPELVIVPHSFPDGEPNLMLEVHQQFKGQGIKVLTYI